MSYQDEELLRMRQKAAEFRKQQISDDTIHDELKQSIYDSVTYITKIPVVFEDKALVDGRLTMRAPKDFEPLPDAVIKQQFIMENRPQYVYKIPYLPFPISLSSHFFYKFSDPLLRFFPLYLHPAADVHSKRPADFYGLFHIFRR